MYVFSALGLRLIPGDENYTKIVNMKENLVVTRDGRNFEHHTAMPDCLMKCMRGDILGFVYTQCDCGIFLRDIGSGRANEDV